MTIDSSMSSIQSGALNAQADQLLQQAKSASSTSTASSKEDAKITKAGTDFESILLGSWLQQAENSFGSVPGGDEDSDADAGKEQFQGLAMQSLAGSLTKSGGIGIAKMITEHLHTADSKSNKTQAASSATITPAK
jgi:Rod binding domain-containing protein